MAPEAAVTIAVRVKPGARRASVGGRYGERALVVAVTERPVDGAATSAVQAALARAFSVRRHQVTLKSGATARDKVFTISGDVAALTSRLDELLQ